MNYFPEPDDLQEMDDWDILTILKLKKIQVNFMNVRVMRSVINSERGRSIQVYAMLTVSIALENTMKPR